MFQPQGRRHFHAVTGGESFAAGRHEHIGAARAAARSRFDLRCVSFGSPAAIVTSMGLIVGLDAATATKASVVGSLLILALADNLTDALSVHMYQEAERLPQRRALYTTAANFATRALLSCTFIAIFLLTPQSVMTAGCIAWGFLLLSGLTFAIARQRGANPFSEIGKHAGVAIVVILMSQAIGTFIQSITAST